MSHLRTYVISRRQFASLGVEQDAETWFERLRQFKLELESDIPSLRSLQASVLKLSFTPSDSGAHLIARLEESEQISLSEHKNGGVVLDLFGIDVRRVQEDQKSIELRIVIAQSPATSAFGDPAVRSIRRRLRTAYNLGDLTIWSASQATSMPLFECPKYIPNSPSTTCRLRILLLSPLRAEVELREDVHFLASEKRLLPMKTKLSLSRLNGHQSVASGSILQHAMDTKSDCEVAVAVVLAWEDGEVSHLELLNFGLHRARL